MADRYNNVDTGTADLLTALGGTFNTDDSAYITYPGPSYTGSLTLAGGTGNIIVGPEYSGSIGASGSPMVLTSGAALVQIAGGGDRFYVNPGAATEVRFEPARGGHLFLTDGSAATLTVKGGVCTVIDQHDANIVTVLAGQVLMQKSPTDANAATVVTVMPAGLVRTGRAFASGRIDGLLIIDDDRATPVASWTGELTIGPGGTLRYIAGAAAGGSSTLVLLPGSTLDLSTQKRALALHHLTAHAGATIRQRAGGPGYTVAGTTANPGGLPTTHYI